MNGQSGSFGITTSNSHNSRLLPTALSASSSNGTALSLSYTYFANANVNVETNGRGSGRTATYTYDSLNRVSQVARTAAFAVRGSSQDSGFRIQELPSWAEFVRLLTPIANRQAARAFASQRVGGLC